MTKLSKKSFLLFVVAVVSMASASSASATNFDGVGQHTLTSSNFAVSIPAFGGGWSCTSSTLEVNVAAGGATASVTGATFDGCAGTGSFAGSVIDVTVTNFPWGFTHLAPNTFEIDAEHMVTNFTASGVTMTYEGSMEGTINNTTHTATFANSPGLTETGALGNAATTVSGTFTDDQHTLAVT
jgi:hypothetical protein